VTQGEGPEFKPQYCKKKKNFDSFIIPYTKIYSKWVIDLYIKVKTRKLLEKKT
jgi:hypothetical protein